MRKQTVFKGCATAIITPFTKDGRAVNFPEFDRIIEDQIENGVDALVVCGTTGEASTMPDDEHLEVIRHAAEAVNKRLPVIAGVGSNDTAHAIRLSQKAQEFGADALLHVTPYYNKTSQSGLIAHFKAIADNVDLPIILYNVPSRTGMSITAETYATLADHEKIVATKEASGNLTAILTAMELCGDRLAFYSGNDDNIVPLMALGGLGVISVLSNVKPKETAALCRHMLEGRYREAAALQIAFMPLINALFSDVSPIPVKAALNILGFEAGPCRLPLGTLSEGLSAKLKALL